MCLKGCQDLLEGPDLPSSLRPAHYGKCVKVRTGVSGRTASSRAAKAEDLSCKFTLMDLAGWLAGCLPACLSVIYLTVCLMSVESRCCSFPTVSVVFWGLEGFESYVMWLKLK